MLARRNQAFDCCLGSRLVVGMLSQKAEMEFRPDYSMSLCLFSCLGELIQNSCSFQEAGQVFSICIRAASKLHHWSRDVLDSAYLLAAGKHKLLRSAQDTSL